MVEAGRCSYTAYKLLELSGPEPIAEQWGRRYEKKDIKKAVELTGFNFSFSELLPDPRHRPYHK
jgi:hypothetical protein